MTINVARHAGFCFGVKRALDIALKTPKADTKVYMLGDIVHNEDVVKQVAHSGIKKVGRLSKGKDKTLLIRAHGAGIDTFKKAAALGYKIVDATCPMVKEIHRIAQEMEEKDYRIIVIGDKRHDEVQGIIGQLKNKALIIDPSAKLPLKMIKKIKMAAVVVQSTQNLEKVQEIVENLKLYIPDLEFCNTICRPTRIKQEEIKKMPKENDAMIIIGSKTSANTRRLYEISKASNKQTYWIKSKRDIQPHWFKNAKSVGISAGASTPDATTQEIVEYIKRVA